MSRDSSGDDLFLVCFGLLIGFCVGMCIAVESHKFFRQEAVDRGFAHHDSKTGEWQWNESEVEE